jgi:hypothetical protein
LLPSIAGSLHRSPLPLRAVHRSTSRSDGSRRSWGRLPVMWNIILRTRLSGGSESMAQYSSRSMAQYSSSYTGPPVLLVSEVECRNRNHWYTLFEAVRSSATPGASSTTNTATRRWATERRPSTLRSTDALTPRWLAASTGFGSNPTLESSGLRNGDSPVCTPWLYHGHCAQFMGIAGAKPQFYSLRSWRVGSCRRCYPLSPPLTGAASKRSKEGTV